jgi:hypothetical protein
VMAAEARLSGRVPPLLAPRPAALALLRDRHTTGLPIEATRCPSRPNFAVCDRLGVFCSSQKFPSASVNDRRFASPAAEARVSLFPPSAPLALQPAQISYLDSLPVSRLTGLP